MSAARGARYDPAMTVNGHRAWLWLGAGAAAAVLACAATSEGWNGRGHRMVTRAAVEALPADAAPWAREPAVLEMIAEQSVEPDRWRGTRVPPMGHENSPDHYLDIELLAAFGLSLESLPQYRYDYVKVMAQAKALRPEGIPAYDPARDRDRSKEWPGFLPHAITEHYAKLVSSFSTLRILEEVAGREPGRVSEANLARARANAIYHMGVLSHFVADAAQPLHTTIHHHGWVGDNPSGYTTDYGFHAYIDGAVIELHDVREPDLRERMRSLAIGTADPWEDTLAHLGRSFEQVETLYRMHKDGSLRGPEGRVLITVRLADAASMLAALYAGAWAEAAPSDEQVANFLKYER